MPSLVTRNRRRIRDAMDFLSAHHRPISITIEGEASRFSSRVIKAEHGEVPSRVGTGRSLLIEMLCPENGNGLIQSSGAVTVSFSFGKSDCEFTSSYIKKSVLSPYYGHLITYPESMTVLERRRNDRYEIGTAMAPLFASAMLTLRTGQYRQKSYDLKVFDISECGVGVLVERGMEELLAEIDPGIRLEHVELLASWTTIKVSGTVKHKSKIKDGKYVDLHLLGIQLDEKLEHYI